MLGLLQFNIGSTGTKAIGHTNENTIPLPSTTLSALANIQKIIFWKVSYLLKKFQGNVFQLQSVQAPLSGNKLICLCVQCVTAGHGGTAPPPHNCRIRVKDDLPDPFTSGESLAMQDLHLQCSDTSFQLEHHQNSPAVSLTYACHNRLSRFFSCRAIHHPAENKSGVQM